MPPGPRLLMLERVPAHTIDPTQEGVTMRTIADLQVSPIGFGGNVFGWTAGEAASHQLLDAFTAQGGNLIDTAD